MPGQTTTEFFDQIGDQYDAAIRRCVPRYHEMLDQMLDYIPAACSARNVLELGCGTGNLTRKILSRFPSSCVTAVDASEKMIELTTNRWDTSKGPGRSAERLNCLQSAFQDLSFPDDTFDLVTSSISLHHLTDAEKLALFGKIRQWLCPGGNFTFCDQFRGETDDLYQKHISNWREASRELGASGEEWQEWMDHQEKHDFHSSIRTHIHLLESAGFRTVDCTRRYFLWTTLISTE